MSVSVLFASCPELFLNEQHPIGFGLIHYPIPYNPDYSLSHTVRFFVAKYLELAICYCEVTRIELLCNGYFILHVSCTMSASDIRLYHLRLRPLSTIRII